MLKAFSHIRSIVPFGAMLFLIFACENEVAKVQSLTLDERIPMEVQENFTLMYSDSTFLRMELKAPLAESYPQLEIPQREFKKGIKVRFLNDLGMESSSLQSDYALQMVNKDLWEARGNVIVINKKGERLNTEMLFWDNRKEIIYSDEFVKITTPGEIIMGEGFQADQNFENYEINKVSGIINIEEDDA
jgi:LPS export ABC transporter protein LptC